MQRLIAHVSTLALLSLSLFSSEGAAQGRDIEPRAAPITNVRYNLTFKAAQGVDRAVDVTMTFNAANKAAVLLSLPVWTPGSYEVTNFARFVSAFSATARGKPVRWDKADPDSWRVFPDAAGELSVKFRYQADSLDNAGSWARDQFALVNGTNVFLYPEGQPKEFAATVTVETESAWRVSTGMTAAGVHRFAATSYHELVDHPFFIGKFDVDSTQIAGIWFRLSAYPAGSSSKSQRAKLFDQLGRAVPKQIAVFRDNPWKRYEIMQIAEPGFGGMSALEHENSNVAVVGAEMLDEDFVVSVYAHEIFHAFNVKRLRPSEMWPYRYDAMQPTPWLWVSEGITDYYSDLSLVRGGVWSEAEFLGTTQRKMEHTEQTVPIALEDASLQAWLHMTDGTSDSYYDKGSLAGLALDIFIRDASDNRASLDDVMRTLYTADFKAGKGFTADEWWSAVWTATGGAKNTKATDIADFNKRFIDGREPFPFAEWFAKAGWRIRSDTIREPRLGVSLQPDSGSVRVAQVDPAGVAAAAGIQPGDVLISIGGVPTSDPSWQSWRAKYAKQEGASLPIRILRDGQSMTVNAIVRLSTLIDRKLEADANATPKARRIREGIVKGITTPR